MYKFAAATVATVRGTPTCWFVLEELKPRQATAHLCSGAGVDDATAAEKSAPPQLLDWHVASAAQKKSTKFPTFIHSRNVSLCPLLSGGMAAGQGCSALSKSCVRLIAL
jgi:hypothetical protein